MNNLKNFKQCGIKHQRSAENVEFFKLFVVHHKFYKNVCLLNNAIFTEWIRFYVGGFLTFTGDTKFWSVLVSLVLLWKSKNGLWDYLMKKDTDCISYLELTREPCWLLPSSLALALHCGSGPSSDVLTRILTVHIPPFLCNTQLYFPLFCYFISLVKESSVQFSVIAQLVIMCMHACEWDQGSFAR